MRHPAEKGTCTGVIMADAVYKENLSVLFFICIFLSLSPEGVIL